MDTGITFLPGELDSIRGAVESVLLDTCIIMRYSPTFSDIGEEIEGYVAQPPIACRFWAKLSLFRPQQDFDLLEVNALMVLPKDTVITARDRVQIVARLGETLATPLLYDLHGDPTPGIESIEVALAEHHL